jgi:hypothetical protein
MENKLAGTAPNTGGGGGVEEGLPPPQLSVQTQARRTTRNRAQDRWDTVKPFFLLMMNFVTKLPAIRPTVADH